MNSTMFYHSHVINGVTIVHSHFYWSHKNTKDKPLKHTHTRDEFFTISVISHFFSTIITGAVFLSASLILFGKLIILLKTDITSDSLNFHYSLRAPPSV